MSRPRIRVPLADLAKYNPTEQNKVKFGFIHDTVIYPAAGADNIPVFAVGVGGQINDGSRAKTEEDTNLVQNGQLPTNKAMLVTGVQVLYLSGMAAGHSEADAASTAATLKFLANDIAAFYNAGQLMMSSGGVEILRDGPLSLFPPASRLEGTAAMANTDTDNNKFVELVNCVGHQYPIEPFTWYGGQSLSAKLVWPNGKVAMPSGLAGRVKIRLCGDIYEVNKAA